MWDNLLEQDPYIQKKVAKGVAKGKAEGEAKGEIRASQRMVIDLVDARFPSLVDLARQRVPKIKETDDLRQLGRQIATAPDEASALRVLSSYAA